MKISQLLKTVWAFYSIPFEQRQAVFGPYMLTWETLWKRWTGAKNIPPTPWELYLQWAQALAGKFEKPRILKIDCHNELYGLPTFGGVLGNLGNKREGHILEYDDESLRVAQWLCRDLKMVRGDMRRLPYQNASFDLLLDLSSIDHIPMTDAAETLKEYHRVLAPRGGILIMAWCSKVPEKLNPTVPWSPTRQYFFDRQKFGEVLAKCFDIEYERETFSFRGDDLIAWCGYKK